jgi:hypothetical protein
MFDLTSRFGLSFSDADGSAYLFPDQTPEPKAKYN